ncbi:kinase-like domain-containing protein [Mycena olivaceomarginata]|nr:kinase-like domain-containing protein [Mycena olivaceomarginata]
MPPEIGSRPPRSAVGEVTGGELFWSNHREWLQGLGYLLRPRYQEGWTPPWTRVFDAIDQETYQTYGHSGIMDATVIADGSFVTMKRIQSPSQELDIAVWFSNEPQRSDPANYCVPILQVLTDPKEEGWAIIVMPLLRAYDKPRFDTIGEAVAFFKQIFEGVQFMHRNNVAHRDCTSSNIMMDGASLYRVPFHPISQDRKRDFSGSVRPYRTRTEHPVKYYLIDFGLSRRYKPEERPPLEPTIRGGDRSAPEIEACEACDPFPTDVYYLGNLIRRDFIEGWDITSQKFGFEFMQPLVTDMVQTDPSKRPDMDEVVRRFNEIVLGLSSWKLRTRVVKRADIPMLGFYYSIPHWLRRIKLIIRRVPPIPVPSR